MNVRTIKNIFEGLDMVWEDLPISLKLDKLEESVYDVYRVLSEMNEESSIRELEPSSFAFSCLMFSLIRGGLDPSVLCEERFVRLLGGAYSISIAGVESRGDVKILLSSYIVMREKEWITSHEGYLQYLDELQNSDN